MAYRLIITKHADNQLDRLVYYLVFGLKSEQAARHLMDGIENVYGRLEENPLQFPRSKDFYLANRDYREAIVPQMNYLVVFKIKADIVYVVGVFHQMENYPEKIYETLLWKWDKCLEINLQILIGMHAKTHREVSL